ncbi:MAG: hypothetical protein Q9187_004161 [Circinaria calcarea]
MALADTIMPSPSVAKDTILESTNAYAYPSLRGKAHEFRLLHLQPAGSPYDLIECSLHVVQMGTNSAYAVAELVETISPSDHVLLFDGHLFPVTEYMYSGLHQLREFGWQWIWMKEVCVDHRNLDEYENQIKLAPAIYQQVSRRFLSPSLKPLALLEYPLLTEVDQIRLLELQPTDHEHTGLQFHFRIVSLRDSPAFTVLRDNYSMPGEATQGEVQFKLNGKALALTPVVYSALKSLNLSENTTLWVEAICVNQDDFRDRSYHAALEQKIFQGASKTLTLRRATYEFLDSTLDSFNSEIRLLRIYPAMSINDPLVVEIFTASLDKKPDYVALSYLWGSNERNFGILYADGREIPVTRNLFVALHELRQHSYQVVWADQICINQLDPQERGQQIVMMNRIYRQARSVVVHLGAVFTKHPQPHSHDTDWLILVRILSLTKSVLRAVRPDRARLDIADLRKFGIPPIHHKSWSSWRMFRTHPWFSRGWIVQEVAANANVSVLCSGRLTKWTDLVDADQVFHFEIMPRFSNNELWGQRGKKLLHNTAHLKTPGKHYPLIKLLSAFRDLHTTDGRDKIYAFRGLATDVEKTPVPDYTKPDIYTYHEFAKYFLSQGQGIDLICEAGLNRTSLEVPSWVPDWSFNTDFPEYNFGQRTSTALNCHLEKSNLGKEYNAEVVLTDDPLIITAKGVIIDTVNSATNGLDWSGSSDTSFQTFSEFDAAACDLLASTEKPLNKYTTNLQDAYARILIANNSTLGDTFFGDPKTLYEEAKVRDRQSRKEGENILGFGGSKLGER